MGTIEYEPPSLVELAARCVKLHGVPYGPGDLPMALIEHLASAKRCVNKRCKGEGSPGDGEWDSVGELRGCPADPVMRNARRWRWITSIRSQANKQDCGGRNSYERHKLDMRMAIKKPAV